MLNRHYIHYLGAATVVYALFLVSITCDDGPTRSKQAPNPNILSTLRASWTLSSRPATTGPLEARSKMLWHNKVEGERSADVCKDMYGSNLPDDSTIIHPLRLIFRPTSPASWAGVMTRFHSIDTTKVQYLWLLVRGSHGKLHLDLGRINEDLDNDHQWDTEDGITSPALRNGMVEPEEDIGLDGLRDEMEPGFNATTNPDPAGDNWYFRGNGRCPLPNHECERPEYFDSSSVQFYEFLNGTEGNREDVASLGSPDEEQLDPKFYNDIDAYFSYVIDLADALPGSAFMEFPPNEFGWRIYRIPVLDPFARDTVVCSQPGIYPSWATLTHVRIWFDASGSDLQPDTIEIAAWRFD